MPNSRFVTATVFALLMQAHGASAQMATPAEYPPASYTSNQFIDSRGCVFVRAAIGGIASWVPRVTRDRQPLCGFQPTAVSGTTAGPAITPLPANAPIITIPGAAAPTTVAAAVPQPTAPAAPAPTTTRAPIATVASTTTAPRIRATQTQLAAPGLTVPAAAPQPIAPSPRIEVAQAAPTLTRSQVCEGKYGVQPGYISSRTRQPIDCGPAPAAVTAPVVIASAATPAPAQQGRRISFQELCADVAATGRRYVNSRTGLEVRCGPQGYSGAVNNRPSGPTGPAAISAPVVAPIAIASSPMPATTVVTTAAPIIIVPQEVRPQAVAAAAPSCAGLDPIAARYLASSRYPVRCGPQGQTSTASTGASSNKLQNPFVRPVPASNPPAGTPAPAQPAQGYKQVWEDGRVNTQRGLPRVQAVSQPQIQISSRSAPQPQVQATGHRYVQVGTYGNATNAQAAVARLQSAGLPAAVGTVTRNGQLLQVVAAGPFGSAAGLNAALGQARSAGFSDAFTRR